MSILLSYKVKTTGTTVSEDGAGFALSLDGLVEKTNSKLQITAKTLVIRMGGFIGMGKNLVWLIIFLLSSCGAIRSFFHKLLNSHL